MKQVISIVALATTTVVLGCASSSAGPREPMVAEATHASTADQQIADGAVLYTANCAGCHGDAGQGTAQGPPVVGEGALPLHPRAQQTRDAEFRTALDVFVWTKANMPPSNPGSVSDANLLAVMAFALSANGITLDDNGLDGEAAAAIVLHK